MATFVLIPGAGSDAWSWSRLVPLLREAGHEAIAIDLPCADDSKDFDDYADVVVGAMRDASAEPERTIVVGHSLGGFTAALVAAREPIAMVVLLTAMVPGPFERPGDWWENTGHRDAYRAAADREGTWSADDFD